MAPKPTGSRAIVADDGLFRAGGALIQRRLAESPGDWDYKNIVRFHHAEIVSKVPGRESETGAFEHAGGSERLDPGKGGNLQWVQDGKTREIGKLHPFGEVPEEGSFVPGVKLHLVNSYLHQEANAEAQNWVWGHKQLNVEHAGPEGEAKREMAEAVKNDGGLQYRTEVVARGPADQSVDEVAQSIVKMIEFMGMQLPDGNRPSAEEVKRYLTIGGVSLDVYVGHRHEAVGSTVATKLEVEWRRLDRNCNPTTKTTSRLVSYYHKAEVRPQLFRDEVLDLLVSLQPKDGGRTKRRRQL